MPLVRLQPIGSRVVKADVLRLLVDTGGVPRDRIGKIELVGTAAVVEVPENGLTRLLAVLDGASLGGRPIGAALVADSSRAASRGASATLAADSVDGQFARMKSALVVEARAAAERTDWRARNRAPAQAEAAGDCLAGLVAVDVDPALGGRYIVWLSKPRGAPLPWTRLRAGSPATLSMIDSSPRGPRIRCLVARRIEGKIAVEVASLPDELDDAEATWRLDAAEDETTFERMRAALDRAQAARGDRLAEWRGLLCGDRAPRFRDELALTPFNAALDASQQAAVRFALSAEDLALIHGPPGTGKTTTLIELMQQAVARGERLLACAPSNLAVDNLLERLVAAGVNAVRLGRPIRVSESLREHTLDARVEAHADVRLARKLVKEALSRFRQADRYTRAKPAPGARRELRQEARQLLDDARRLESQAADHVLDTAQVLCSTLTALDASLIGSHTFDLAVIDEACQAVEPACWIAFARANRLVLAGDHCQLPPTVLSPAALRDGLGMSLFERLAGKFGAATTRRLTVQYRMHAAIAEFSSREFYDGELTPHPSVASHTLADLVATIAGAGLEGPLDFIDTAGAGYDEEVEPDGESRLNRHEARLAAQVVRQLCDAGVAPDQIAIIAPYSAQVRLLRELLPATERGGGGEMETGLEIDTVDGFQGREKEVIILTLVRSNPQAQTGFLAETRRTNVALTRAKRRLVVIGDSATLGSEPFYRRLCEHFEVHGAYRTVWEVEAT